MYLDALSMLVKRHHGIPYRNNKIFQPYKKEVQKYSAGAEMRKPQNKFPILNELSRDLGFF